MWRSCGQPRRRGWFAGFACSEPLRPVHERVLVRPTGPWYHDVIMGQYTWQPGEIAPDIGEHSLAKHEVLRSYLGIYVDVLTSDPRREELRLTLVDGFAGGGLYRHPVRGTLHEGSPLIMLRAMEEAEFRAQQRRTKKGFRIDARFFFVESDEATFACLRHNLANPDFINKFKHNAIQIQSTFVDAAPRLLTAIESGAGRDPIEHRCIFLLDQYGWSDVPLDIIRAILQKFHKAEILLTFSTDKLINFFSRQDLPTLRRVGLHSLADHLPELTRANPAIKRRLIQCHLTDALISGCGASFFTPFFIRPATANNNDYWFVHLSNHVRARDEMTKLHWSLQNHFTHYGEAGLSMLGYDPRKDDELQGQATLFDFSNDAKPRTEQALREQLVRRISEQWPDGVRFDEMVRSLCNETPAHKGMIHDVLRGCVSDREVDLRAGKTGRPRASHIRNIDDADVIRYSRNLILDFKPKG